MRVMTSVLMMAAALGPVACGGSSSSAPVGNAGGAQGKRPAGDPLEQLGAGFRDGALWSCQISDYDPQPCKLHRDGDGWRLTKLLGSQRFDGALGVRGAVLGFAGQFFCPWGACDAPMNVEFVPEGPDGSGPYVADFDGDTIRLRYDEGVAGEYGGAGYGGLTGREQ